MINNNVKLTEGMFLLIDRQNAGGLKHWVDELTRRTLPACIAIEKIMADQYVGLIKETSLRGFEVCGIYNERPFWNEPYKFQYEEMSIIKDKIESRTDKPMRVFGSKYFAYDENTLKAAEALGVKYIFARGPAGARSVLYKPEEYNAQILAVSNIPASLPEMGTGSLCDESLWSRGESPEGLKNILFSIKEERIIMVAQTHLSGVKLHWWNAYQDFLNANTVKWKSLDEFNVDPLVLPFSQIPMNTEVKYTEPKPRKPLEQEPDYIFEDNK
jgi:hypothetical protein